MGRTRFRSAVAIHGGDTASPTALAKTDEVLRAALDYARLGWPVFPLHGLRAHDGVLACECRDGGDCKRPGKHPMFGGWQQQATTDIYVITSWRRRFPNSNLGIRTGPETGLAVLDFDPKNGSEASLARIEREICTLPLTATTATGGGGEHRFFNFPCGRVVGNALPVLAHGYDGIDVRGEGGLVVAPPSLHVSGQRYRWTLPPGSTPLADLPAGLLIGCRFDPSSLPCPEDVDPYGWAVLIRESDRLARAREGTRNEIAVRAATRVGQVLRATGLDEDDAYNTLFASAIDAGLPDDEATSVIERGLRFGIDRPRRIEAPFATREEALEELVSLRVAFVQHLRPGHQGTRMHQTYEALLRLAEHAGGPCNFRAGTRRIAIEAGISPQTATRALLELREPGWLVRLQRGFNDQPSAWSLRLPETVQSSHRGTPPVTPIVSTLHDRFAPVGHDAFRGRVPLLVRDVSTRGDRPFVFVPSGLRGTRWQMYERLRAEGRPMRRSALAQALNKDPSTIRRNLPMLIEHGMVECNGQDLIAVAMTESDLDEIARKLQTAGASIEQRRSHGWNVPSGPLPEQRITVIPPRRKTAEEQAG
jgi:Bifunctional DNA primase/polymerase, N-terminal